MEEAGYEILGEQVVAPTSKELRFIDFLVYAPEGELKAIAVKANGARRSSRLKAKDDALETEGGTLVGKNAPEQFRGRTLKIETEVYRVQVP